MRKALIKSKKTKNYRIYQELADKTGHFITQFSKLCCDSTKIVKNINSKPFRDYEMRKLLRYFSDFS